MPLQLTIMTPERKAFEGKVDSVVIPGVTGSFGVLPRHARMLSAVGRGILKATADGVTSYFVIVNEGVAEVRPDRVAVMVDQVIAATDAQNAADKLDELRLNPDSRPVR